MVAGEKPVRKVKRSALAACMTCPLCDKLLRQATTISLCLHTFCRKCIYDLLSDEEVDTCPVCDIDLGISPIEKLRPDHNLQDIRAKVFPFKSKKVAPAAPAEPAASAEPAEPAESAEPAEPAKVVTSIAPPVKRKERSLSSLVVSTPKVPEQASLTRKKTKPSARKLPGLRGCEFKTEESNKDEDSAEDHPNSASSPESENKALVKTEPQDSAVAEPSNEEEQTNENGGDADEIVEGKADLWAPLNCLVEALNRTKASKSNKGYQVGSGSGAAKPELSNGPNSGPNSLEKIPKVESSAGNGSETSIYKSKSKEVDQGINFQVEVNDMAPEGPQAKRRRLSAARRRAALCEELSNSTKVILDAAMKNGNRRDLPVWFSLVASNDKNEDASLPQIRTSYLRIKDGKMPVSFIQKYLVKKLDLSNEGEVEIMCRGEPVVPTLQLQNLVDLWFRNASTTRKVPTTVGSSGKDFVMVLSYCRKVEAS